MKLAAVEEGRLLANTSVQLAVVCQQRLHSQRAEQARHFKPGSVLLLVLAQTCFNRLLTGTRSDGTSERAMCSSNAMVMRCIGFTM